MPVADVIFKETTLPAADLLEASATVTAGHHLLRPTPQCQPVQFL
jgi:hypothetical protein